MLEELLERKGFILKVDPFLGQIWRTDNYLIKDFKDNPQQDNQYLCIRYTTKNTEYIERCNSSIDVVEFIYRTEKL